MKIILSSIKKQLSYYKHSPYGSVMQSAEHERSILHIEAKKPYTSETCTTYATLFDQDNFF